MPSCGPLSNRGRLVGRVQARFRENSHERMEAANGPDQGMFKAGVTVTLKQRTGSAIPVLNEKDVSYQRQHNEWLADGDRT